MCRYGSLISVVCELKQRKANIQDLTEFQKGFTILIENDLLFLIVKVETLTKD